MEEKTDKDTNKPIQGLKLKVHRAVYNEVFAGEMMKEAIGDFKLQ